MKKTKRDMVHKSNHLPPPKVIYRYLPTKDLADAMVAGFIRISTLHEVRTGESLRADAKDATLNYRVREAVWFGNDIKTPEAENLERLGVNMGNSEFCGFINCTIRSRHPDAYVLCTARSSCDDKKMRRVFGVHKVRIADPLAFIHAISSRLIDYIDGDFEWCAGSVNYEGRDRQGREPLNVSPIFVGHPENGYESEWRIVWTPTFGKGPTQSLDLYVPEIARLCSICN